MKQNLFLAVSAVLLAIGCQKTEIQNEVLTPIGFSTEMNKLTKAPDAESAGKMDNLIQQGFHVWGLFFTKGDLNYDAGDYYLDNIKVTALPSDPQKWETGKETYYWPGKNKELDIYAVSAWDDDYNLAYVVEDDKKKCNVAVDFDNRVVTISNFVVNQNADNDLMVAPMIRQDQDDAKYIVPEFVHALTKVLVNFRKSSTTKGEVYVKSAKISAIPSTSTLTVKNTEPTEPAERGAKKSTAELIWGTASTPIEYHAQCKVTPESVPDVISSDGINKMDPFQAVKLKAEDNNAVDKGFITYGSWLLLPQTDLSNTYLDVEYVVDGMYIKQSFALAVGDISSWDQGQQTTYNVTISPEYIEFTPDVQDWETESNPSKEEDYNS